MCSHLIYSDEDEYILACLGLVKHPQVMSCIYITLFLVTMLIIAQQVIALYSSFTSCYVFFQCLCFHVVMCFCHTERVLLPPGLPTKV